MTTLRALSRFVITPAGYNRARYCKWWVSSYLPRLVRSRYRVDRPQIRGFGRDSSPRLVALLEQVNTLAPTAMCRVMTAHGSDKGHVNHNYTTVYSALFNSLRDQPLRILEIGLGTVNHRCLPI